MRKKKESNIYLFFSVSVNINKHVCNVSYQLSPIINHGFFYMKYLNYSTIEKKMHSMKKWLRQTIIIIIGSQSDDTSIHVVVFGKMSSSM